MMMRTLGTGILAAAMALAGCSAEETSPGTTQEKSVTQAGVLTFATFARILDDKTHIAEGLNIDGRVTPDGDTPSCGMKDFTSPDGEPGIDNQFGGLLPVIEGYVGSENIGALLAAAIANGQLLILIAIDDLDDPMNDDDVTVRIAAGKGVPLLDAQGKFVTYQTFGFNREQAPVSTLPGKVKDGVVHIGPGDAVLPVRVLTADFNLNLHGVVGRIDLTPDTNGGGMAMKGTLAGGIEVADFKGIIASLDIGEDVISMATGLIGLLADLHMDDDTGKCTQVSAGLRIEATPAFILDK
ncbi:Hypothetical protein A7982_07770 [Minicystis rosea]|nr:Hypothetical protein A7982_07770 [Minicystis rosea]